VKYLLVCLAACGLTATIGMNPAARRDAIVRVSRVFAEAFAP